MKDINKLGLKVVGITIVILFAIFGIYKTVQGLLGNQADKNNPAVAESTPNTADWDPLIQNLYRNEEIPSKENTEIELSEEDVQEIFAQLNVPDPNTFTGKYLAGLPDDASREHVLDKERITVFVNQNKGTLLPHYDDDDIIIKKESAKDDIANYLKSVSHLHNPEIKHITNTDIEKAHIIGMTDKADPSMQNIINALQKNKEIILATPVPATIKGLHIKMISAGEALVDNLILLKNTNEDFIGGLIGAKKIEELGAVFEEIGLEIAELEDNS